MQNNIRQLAAIMFTDMVGYTALMQSDELKAIQIRDRHRNILEKRIRKYNGLLLQYYGDGSLSVFGSAIDAASCAVQIQLEMQEEPVIPVRIGLNIGDIVYADDGVYGDGVNVAARVESMSVPGAVLLSDKMYDEIKNHPQFPVIELGTFKLKNVKRQTAIYAISYTGLYVPGKDELKGKTEQKNKSIAVLPFVNMSSSQENEYFSDGISEEIINALTRIDGLQVISRTSAFAFKDKNIDIRKIGTDLNVNNILEGSVRQAGKRVRITAQLINTADGYHLWSETYDRDLEDIFEVQDEIARKITNSLREKLSFHEQNDTLVKAPTGNMAAYNLYLQGQYYWNKWSPEHTLRAKTFFEKAIEIQPDFALPYAGISSCFTFLGSLNMMRSDSAFIPAREFALKSLEIDPFHPMPHLALAMVEYFYDWNWSGAEKSFKKALELSPGAAYGHHYYSMYLMTMRRNEQALDEALHACKLDPLSLPVSHNLAGAYIQLGQFDKAIEQLEKILEVDQNFILSTISLGWAYLELGKENKAMEFFLKAGKQMGNSPKAQTFAAYIYGKTGKQSKAEEILERMKESANIDQNIMIDQDMAIVYAGLGDYESAFKHLNKALESKLASMVFITHTQWRALHSDPRFKKILRAMGLSQIQLD